MEQREAVGLLFNSKKETAVAMAKRLLAWGKAQKIPFLLPPHEASVLEVPETSDQEWRNSVQFAVVIGGDGTFLRAARYVLGFPIPLYGINVGRLGFLAIGEPSSAERDIEAILAGKHSLQARHLVKGIIWRNEHPIHEMYALNDLVITKGAFARVIYIEIHVGHDELLSILPVDGMIVSTPTGSTAYALSAGGPIVPPHVPCMIIAPICAHTLYARPVALAENDIAWLIPQGDHRDLMLTQDGQLGYELIPGDKVQVSLTSEKQILTISLPHRSYYDLLRKKLQWGHGYADSWGD